MWDGTNSGSLSNQEDILAEVKMGAKLVRGFQTGVFVVRCM